MIFSEAIDDKCLRMYLDEDMLPRDAFGSNANWKNVQDDMEPDLCYKIVVQLLV